MNEELQPIVKASEALIPTKKKVYYDRKLIGMDVMDLLNRTQLNQFNLKFQGPTGSGKTTYFKAFCHKTKQPHFMLNMKGSTVTEEIIGAHVPNDKKEGGDFVWKDGLAVRALRYSNAWIPTKVTQVEEGVFDYAPQKDHYIVDTRQGVLDEDDILEDLGEDEFMVKAWPRCMLTIEEINFSPEELMSVWFSLLDDRRDIVLNEKDGADQAELAAWASEGLAAFKVPEHWHLTTEALPRNATGKILKDDLRKQLG